MASLWASLAGALALGGLAPSCLLTLDTSIACGDGYVDREAGEECDPADKDSFATACLGTSRPWGIAACDPVSCTIINDSDQCAVCGDGIIDLSAGEECDGDDVAGKQCDSGRGEVRCDARCKLDYSGCDLCGDRKLDPGEECDYVAEAGGIVNEPSIDNCRGLTAPIPGKPYAGGESDRCLSDCTRSRVGCHYCGDGTIDGQELLGMQDGEPIYSEPELCDGDRLDLAHLGQEFGTACYMQDLQLRPNVGCSDDCKRYVDRRHWPGGGECCRLSGEACPINAGDLYYCCYQYTHPNEDPCKLEVVDGNIQLQVCK